MLPPISRVVSPQLTIFESILTVALRCAPLQSPRPVLWAMRTGEDAGLESSLASSPSAQPLTSNQVAE